MSREKKIEAYLRISSKMGSMAALDKTAAKLQAIDQKAKAFNRSQTAMGRAQAAVNRSVAAFPAGRFLGGAAVAYGAKEAYTHFAGVERSLTRTGIKLGATKQQMTDTFKEMGQIANKYAVPINDVMSAFDTLAESGNSFEDSRAMLDSMVQATQGMGGAAEHTVATFDAARKSFGLATKDAERFFDIVAAGGAMGKFEGSDLAQYLPSLMPTAARQGYSGLDGSARLVAALEVMRDFVGTSEEANTATADFFDKIASTEVQNNFKKFGVDLEKRLAKAREEGEDVLQVMHDLIREATKGDASKLSKLFGDRDSRRFADMLLKHIDRINDAYKHLRDQASGTIRANVNVVTANAQAQLDRLSNNWERLKASLGSKISVIVSPVLENFNDKIDDADAFNAGVEKEKQRGGSMEEAYAHFKDKFGDFNPDYNNWNPFDNRRRESEWQAAMQALGRGEIGSIGEWFTRDNRAGREAQLRSDRAERGREPPPLPPKGLPDAVPVPQSREEAEAAAKAQKARDDQYEQLELARRRNTDAAAKVPPGRLPLAGEFGSVEEQQEYIRKLLDNRRKIVPDPAPGADRSSSVITGSGGDDRLYGGFSADELARAIADGSREMDMAGDAFGTAVDGAGSAFEQQVSAAAARMSQAADKMIRAADALAARLANVKVNVQAVGGNGSPGVRADVGRGLAGVGGRNAE